MNKNSNSYVYHVRQPVSTGRGPTLVITPRTPDGRHADSARRLEREFGRNAAINLSADLLRRVGVPDELVEQIRAQQEAQEVELVSAEATPEEIEIVERLVTRWSLAVDQALQDGAIKNATASTYRQHPQNFLAWVKGQFQPGGSGRRRRYTEEADPSGPDED